MNFQALANYIIIAVPKEEEKDKRQKEGRFYVPQGYTMYQRNTQSGIIVSIGSDIRKHIGDIKLGHIAIVHHNVQGSEKEGGENRCFEDEKYFYYPVCCAELEGRRNSFFGVWDGEKIVAHEDYVFLEEPIEEESGIIEMGSGLLVVKQKNDRNAALAKIKRNREIMDNISKGVHNENVAKRFTDLEKENKALMMPFSAKTAIPMNLVAIHHSVGTGNNKTIFITASATNYKVEFMGKNYIVAETKYIHASS